MLKLQELLTLESDLDQLEEGERDAQNQWDNAQLNLTDVLNNALDTDGAPKDLDFDDSHITEFPNFFKFAMSKEGMNQAPFARQLVVATHLLGEWCPRCSNPKFADINNVPVNYPAEDFPSKVTFLENGVCPKCSATRSEMYLTEELNVYEELDGCAGQRCVVGDTLVAIPDQGLLSISAYAQGKDVGFTPMNLKVKGKKVAVATQFFKSGLDIIYTLETPYGRLQGTGDHPVYTYNGYKKLRDITRADEILHYLDTRVFGHQRRKQEFNPASKSVPPSVLIGTEKVQTDYLCKALSTGTESWGCITLRLPTAKVCRDFQSLAFNNGIALKYVKKWGISGAKHLLTLEGEHYWKYANSCIHATTLLPNAATSAIGVIPLNILNDCIQLITKYAPLVCTKYITSGYSKHKLSSILANLTTDLGDLDNLDKVRAYLKGDYVLSRGTVRKGNLRDAQPTYDFHIPVEHCFITNGMLSHNSGKSALLGGLLLPYITHKWLMVNKPVETLGLMSSSLLVGSFIGLTYAKAVELLFQPFHTALSDSPWFQTYHKMLDDYEEKTGKSLYKVKDTFIHYYHKNIKLEPNGPNKRTLRGATRIFAAIDELGWFPHGEDNDSKERASANEVYVAIDRSLKTVRGAALTLLESGNDNIMMGLGLNISSPSSYMDKIMTLIRTHEGSREVYTYHLPTWEMNPHLPRKAFVKEYRDNPIKAERDFGANPPMSENPWVNDIDHIKTLMRGRFHVKYRYKRHESRSGQPQRYAAVTKTKTPKRSRTTVLSIDAGYSNNSFSLAITRPTDIGAEVLAVAEVAPLKGGNVLNYTYLAQQLIYPMIEAFNVQVVLADRWQSIKILSDIEGEFGIITDTHSLRPSDFSHIYDHLTDDTDNYIKLPKPEMSFTEFDNLSMDGYPHCFKYRPAAHLLHQFMTATLDSRGSVMKGEGYTDDVLRAACLGLHVCLTPDLLYQYGMTEEEVEMEEVCVGSGTASSSPDFSFATLTAGTDDNNSNFSK